MTIWTWIAVAIAGAIGAPLRFLIERAVQARVTIHFPFGTFFVNMTGSVLYGFIAGLAIYHGFPDAPKVVLTSGFCGAYTTFSAMSYESVRLTTTQASRTAVLYLGSSIVVGWAMAALGMAIAAIKL